MIILYVIIFKLSQKQDKRFLHSSLDVNGHFVWNRLSAELQISYFLSNHLDGLPVDPEVHVLVLRHDPPPTPPRQRLPDQEGDPLPADRDTRTPGLRLVNLFPSRSKTPSLL